MAAGLSLPKAIADGAGFKVVMVDGATGTVYATHSADGMLWAAPVTVAVPNGGVTNWDPTIFKGADGVYNVFFAPDLGTGPQQIAWARSADGVTWSGTSSTVTAGGYGAANWWDYWPEAGRLGGQDTLFYTSEKDGTAQSSGHIMLLPLTWDQAHNHLDAIAPALATTNDGDTVRIAGGTYDEPTLTLPGHAYLTVSGADANDRPILVNGLALGNQTSLTLRDMIVHGAGRTSVITGGSITNLTLTHVQIDGENDPGRHGYTNGVVNGDITITGCEFLNIKNWSAFDTRSGSGGPTQGANLGVVVFSNNVVHNTEGHINFRGTIDDPATSVTITGNTVTQVGNATNSFGGILKVFYAQSAVVTGNVIQNVGTSGYNPSGEAAYGAGLMLRNVTNITVTGNVFANNNQAIAIEPRNGNPGGFADGVLPSGVISGNQFINNAYGVYLPALLHPTSALGGLSLAFNRFSGNGQAVHNGGGAPGILNAENNWWGCNSGPNTAGCDTTGGAIDANPWLTLRVSVTPAPVPLGSYATVNADVTHNSAGTDTSAQGRLPDGTPIAFTTTLGTIGASATTLNGVAATPLLVGRTSGYATITAKLDHATAALLAQIGNPTSKLIWVTDISSTTRVVRRQRLLETRVTLATSTGGQAAGAKVTARITYPNGQTVTRTASANASHVATFSWSSMGAGNYTVTVLSVTRPNHVYNAQANLETSDTVTLP